MTGIDTIYYSETPIEPLTQENVCKYYTDAVGREVTFETKPNICSVWYKGSGEEDFLEKNTYIIRIDTHHLAVLESYSYYSDATLYNYLSIEPIVRSCLYY